MVHTNLVNFRKCHMIQTIYHGNSPKQFMFHLRTVNQLGLFKLWSCCALLQTSYLKFTVENATAIKFQFSSSFLTRKTGLNGFLISFNTLPVCWIAHPLSMLSVVLNLTECEFIFGNRVNCIIHLFHNF